MGEFEEPLEKECVHTGQVPIIIILEIEFRR